MVDDVWIQFHWVDGHKSAQLCSCKRKIEKFDTLSRAIQGGTVSVTPFGHVCSYGTESKFH